MTTADDTAFWLHCDICRRSRRHGLPTLVRKARFRVFFGSYGTGGWALCEEHYGPLLDEKLPKLVVNEGMRCRIVELVPDPRYPGDFIHQDVATLRRKEAST